MRIFDNIIIRNNTFIFIDYEWLLEDIPKTFILYRVVLLFNEHKGDFFRQHGIDVMQILKAIGITQQAISYYEKLENIFLSKVCDNYSDRYKKHRNLI